MGPDLEKLLPAPIGITLRPDAVKWTLAMVSEFTEAYLAAMRDFEKVYGSELGSGAERCVYDGGDVVYKVGWPEAQLNEVAAFEDPRTYGGLPVAPCRIVWHESGLPIVIMLTVRPATPDDEDLPDWSTRIDHNQVGWRDGQWYVYDAGSAVGDLGENREHWLDSPLPRIFQDIAA